MIMNDSVNEEIILQWFPELIWISDGQLRSKCIKAFEDAFRQGGWTVETAEKLFVSVSRVNRPRLKSYIAHVRAVTQTAAGIYDSLEKIYDNHTGLRDTVIAGALLHDIGKPLEFTLSGEGKICYAAHAKIMRHPLSGSILAAKDGLPDEVIHIIAVHSFEGEQSHKTLAAQIVCAADEIAFRYLLAFDENQ